MPEPLSNQSGAEQELPQYIECLLSVSGDAAFLNTFDKADRPPNTKPRYSFHALFPVPEEIQRRGFLKAGRLWCAGYWEAGGDLCEMQVKRVLGERRYRFFVWDTLPKNMFRVVSRHYPTLKFCSPAPPPAAPPAPWAPAPHLREYMIAYGQYMGCYRRNETDAFAQIREGMGFQP